MSDTTAAAPHMLYAEFTAIPGEEETVKELLTKLTEDVRNEPGNIDFTCYTHTDKPARFFVYEVYRDRAAFDAHVATPHCAEFNAKVAPFIAEPNTELTFLEPLSATNDAASA
jgi:quinol monooxygenase YgiN